MDTIWDRKSFEVETQKRQKSNANKNNFKNVHNYCFFQFQSKFNDTSMTHVQFL